MDGVLMDGAAMADGNPPQLFRRMMVTKLRQSLAAVQATPQFLPTQVRDQALHILSYGLKKEARDVEGCWKSTRYLLLEMAPRMELMGHRLDWLPFLKQAANAAQHNGDIHTFTHWHIANFLWLKCFDKSASFKKPANGRKRVSAIFQTQPSRMGRLLR